MVQRLAAYLTDIEQRLGPHFACTEPRLRAMTSLRGLFSSVERQNGRQLAEVSSQATPDGFQHLLGRADWDADVVRDAPHLYIVQHLGAPDPRSLNACHHAQPTAGVLAQIPRRRAPSACLARRYAYETLYWATCSATGFCFGQLPRQMADRVQYRRE